MHASTAPVFDKASASRPMDVKQIIKDMLAKGMSEEQVIATLEEMGVEDARALFDEATERLKTVDLEEEAPAEEKAVPKAAAKPAKVEAEEGEEAEGAEAAEAEEAEPGAKEAPGKAGAAAGEGVEEKLEDVLALLKALQEINKKILETDRSVLLRLREKQASGSA